MTSWLREAISASREHLLDAYLFGSALVPGCQPRDVDIVLVTADRAGEAGWLTVRRWRDQIAADFEKNFGLPLSAMVVTRSEWSEIDGVVVRERSSLM